ncbi:MAG: CBS domain-containing protein [Gaiellaceae bacterium]|jgi:CBS domain-containing protein
MRVEQVMSREVLTVAPETSLKDVAGLLSHHRISGLPVCDANGRVLGVISEADILQKEQGRTPEGSGLFAWLFERDNEAAAKIAARTAGEAMTSPAVSIEPGRPLSEAARLMIERSINRLPVVANNELVGIVTRADLVRAFHRSDEEIKHEISDDVLLRTLWFPPERLTISVENGEVTLGGKVDNRSEAELAAAFVSRVPGVIDVHSNLTWSVDDLARRTGSERLPKRL